MHWLELTETTIATTAAIGAAVVALVIYLFRLPRRRAGGDDSPGRNYSPRAQAAEYPPLQDEEPTLASRAPPDYGDVAGNGDNDDYDHEEPSFQRMGAADSFPGGPPSDRSDFDATLAGAPALFEPVDGPGDYRVWFGTNRKPLSDTDPSMGFSGERCPEVRYGGVTVHIPESHKIGSIGSPLIFRLITRTDDRLKIRRRWQVPADTFWADIAEQLAAADPEERHAVVFIHGYNVSFDEAAVRAAQIGKDLGISGAMAFFSWPSKGSVEGYAADGATIEASESAIADFLADFATRSGASAVHVIAHSMGNRGLLRAITRIASDAERTTGVRFGQFILAAPDVDADTFLDLARRYKEFARRSTLYVSSRDRAVGLSKWLHDYPRVGFAPPISIFPNIDTVNVDNVDLTMIGHGYVGEARDVLQDMHRLIFEDLPPSRRFGLQPAKTNEGNEYWVIGK